MSLEINRNDSSIDTRQIPQHGTTFQRTIAGLLTTLILFSGSLIGPTTVYAAETPSTSQSQTYIDPSTVIDIPEEHQYVVAEACGKEKGEPITVGDLNAIKDNWMTLTVYDDTNLEWLNHLGQVEYLSIIIHADDMSLFRKIKSLKNVNSISITPALNNSIDMTSQDFAFIKNSSQLKELSISGEVGIEPGFIESLTNLQKLNFFLQDGNHTYDCTKLDFLNELKLHDPYTAAMYITTEEYNYLKSKGVKISFPNEEQLKTFVEINHRLDQIVESIGLDENSSEQDKFNAIICYVLDNLSYDEQVSDALANDEPIQSLAADFYEGGLLYGALEKESAICGNYAALTNALLERLNIDTYYLTSHNHAWSLVEIEGKQYYVDSTWLDGKSVYKKETEYVYDDFGNIIASSTSWTPIGASEAIKEGNTEELDWYMEDPSSYPKSESQAESHMVVNLPDFFGIVPQEESDEIVPETTEIAETTPAPTETVEQTEPEETQPIVLDDENVEIRSGDKKWIVPAAVAIGVLTAIGGAVAVKKNKDKKERERRRRQAMYSNPFGDDFSSPYGNSYQPYNDFDFSSSSDTSRKSSRRHR